MQSFVIQIFPTQGGWGVFLGDEVHAQFPVTAQAVAFAQALANRLGRQGVEPRIFVDFADPKTLQ